MIILRMKVIDYSKLEILTQHSIRHSICLVLWCLLLVQTNSVYSKSSSENQENNHWIGTDWLDTSWLPQSLQIHGFFSQGFVHTTNNQFFGKSQDSVSTDYRELGLNGSWRATPELRLAMQIVYRDAGKTDDKTVRVDYGLADFSVYSSESTQIGIKGGRIPTPLGFFNETRDVLSSRPTILLPQSIYFDRNRNIALSADGGYIHGEKRTDFGDFFIDIGGVIPRTDDPDASFSLTGNLPGKLEGRPSLMTRFAYEWQGGRVRTSITYSDYNVKYHSKNPFFQSGKIDFNPLIFSVQYNGENWSLTGEYEFNRRQFSNFVALPDSDTTGIGYYVQGVYKFTDWMEGVVRYDKLVTDKNDKDGKRFSALTQGTRPSHSRFAEDITVGVRFTLIPNLLFSAEYHRINGTGWLAEIENKDLSKTKKRWNILLWMVSYSF
ncbi:MAG: hypothetical protein K0U68_03540 [Gammaproteobacteria bacterium]|nr:hypothetical protein [Gammaproteobacteria bacterium]